MNKKEFEILENADDDTINMIENSYPVIDEKKKEEIFKMTMKKMDEQKTAEYTEFSEKIGGVEKYKRPIWQKVSAIAAAATIVAGGAVVFANVSRDKDSDKNNYMTEVTNEATTEAVTAYPTEEYEIVQNVDEEDLVRTPEEKEADIFAESMYKAVNSALTDMYDEGLDTSGFFIVSSDDSLNYDVSKNFDTALFKSKVKEYFAHVDTCDYFIVIEDGDCVYIACEKPNADNTDTIFASYPPNAVCSITTVENDGKIEYGENDYTSITDIYEEPTTDGIKLKDIYEHSKSVIDLTLADSDENEPEHDKPTPAELNEQTEAELTAASKDCIDKYHDIMKFYISGSETDKSQKLEFTVIPNEFQIYDPENGNETDEAKLYDIAFNRLTSEGCGTYYLNSDDRFATVDELRKFASSVLTDTFFNANFSETFVDRLDGAKAGDKVEFDRLSRFIMYDNKLYVHSYIPGIEISVPDWEEEPVGFYDVTENSFMVKRKYIVDDFELITDFFFEKDSETGKWLISGVADECC